jgi:biopolymer transport protein ExbB
VSDAAIFNRDDQGHGFQIGIDHGIPYVEVSDQAGVHRSSAGPAITPAHWHHLAVVSDGSRFAIYLDGEPYSTLAAKLPGLAGGATLGAGDFAGDLDELEIYHAAKSAAAIKFAALEQGGAEATAKILDVGPDEQATNWLSWLSTGYVGIILKSLTADGWVVIGLLGVMAMISWAVMVTKASYLNATAKGNTLFLNRWRELAADLTALDWKDEERVRTLGGRVRQADEKTMRDAAVYRIYHIGAEEIRHRLRRGDSLTARSMEAIRASLDGGLVRETQRLNRFLVLLTIAISGGPFLGLLGTVVGVMITFAAIAAAGDVNVNSIAPGIAAALAATVAGLLVAIPSLFGYNYLLGRVKNATSDMVVFIDEFVARMAEIHGEGEE